MSELLISPDTRMIFKQAPGAGPDAHKIWDKGIKGWGNIDLENFQPPELPDDQVISVEAARRNSFCFIEVWGRKAQDLDEEGLNPVASISHFQPGLGMVNSEQLGQFRDSVTQSFIAGLDESEYMELNFGARKRLLLVESDLTAEEMHQRLLNAPDDPYRKLFGHLSEAQQTIQNRRKNSASIFEDVFNGETDGLRRPFQEIEDEEDAEEYDWGWEETNGELVAINCDFGRQSLDDLAKNATMRETKHLLNIVNKFMKGKRGKNRFVIQIDNGEDAVCCNTAFNASVQITTSDNAVFKHESDFKISHNQTSSSSTSINLGNTLTFNGLPKERSSKAKCKTCGKNTSSEGEDGCNCAKKDKSN